MIHNWFSIVELCRLSIFGSYLSVQQKLFFTLKKIIYPLLLPSHNCIINSQCSVFKVHFRVPSKKKLNEVMIPHRFSQFLFKKWWAKMDSNHRPHDYQSCALASWAIGPYQALLLVESTGIEPVTSCLQGRRSPSWANPPFPGSLFLRYIFLYPLNWITHWQATLVLTLGRY